MPIKITTAETHLANAKVSNYFKPTISNDPTPKAVFQGHLLQGTKS